VKGIKLAGTKERAPAILAWASENGKDRLTTNEIEGLWKKTHFKVAGDLGRDLGLAAKEVGSRLRGRLRTRLGSFTASGRLRWRRGVSLTLTRRGRASILSGAGSRD
jgi:hypothetical protein